MTDITETALELRELLAKATPGPYRAHDHNNMRHVGENPDDWIGYAWVGRITKSSGPNGNFDAGWANMDRRKDGSREYRERASADAHFVAAALNALPTLLDHLTASEQQVAAMRAENERLSKAVMGGILPGLLDTEETDALVDFVKSLRDGSALAALDAAGTTSPATEGEAG